MSPYSLEIHPKCKKTIVKASKKNPLLKEILTKKIKEITLNPYHYKPLKHDLAGERRVHILKSFVLKFEISENTIRLIAFEHHDDAYK